MLLVNSENLYLIVIGLIWIVGAVLQDLKRREVDNLWNFSLIAFVLAYRAGVSVYNQDVWFLINGILGLIIFLFLGNLFYYSRLFAGGDAKLLIALGPILPLSYNWIINFKIIGLFVLLFLIMGSVYVLFWAMVLVIENRKDFIKEFKLQWKDYNKLFLIFLGFSIVLGVVMILLVNFVFGISLALVFLSFPILFVFSKAVEESCMKTAMTPEELTEGEWLYEDITVAGKKIKADWEGVSKEELDLIQKKYKKKILIKKGIPFTPGFLLAFCSLLILFWKYSVFF